jgi:hypothetical protein
MKPGELSGVGLRAGWSGVRVLAGAENSSLYHCVQTGSGVHSASYPVCTRGYFLEVKWTGREADDSPLSSAEIKNAWSYTSIPQYAFIVWWSVKAQGQLYLYLYNKI